MTVEIEFDNFSDAESDIVCAKAILEIASETALKDSGRHLSDAIFGAIRLLDNALASIESGKVRGH